MNDYVVKSMLTSFDPSTIRLIDIPPLRKGQENISYFVNETLTLKAFDDATSIFANKSKVSHWEYLYIAAVYLSIYIVNTAPLLLDPH